MYSPTQAPVLNCRSVSKCLWVTFKWKSCRCFKFICLKLNIINSLPDVLVLFPISVNGSAAPLECCIRTPELHRRPHNSHLTHHQVISVFLPKYCLNLSTWLHPPILVNATVIVWVFHLNVLIESERNYFDFLKESLWVYEDLKYLESQSRLNNLTWERTRS